MQSSGTSASDSSSTHSEFLIPPSNSNAEGTAVESETLVARAYAVASSCVDDSFAGVDGDNCGAPPASCRTWLLTLAAAAVGDQVSVVAPRREPQMALPLGWALSTLTEDTMDTALDGYIPQTCGGPNIASVNAYTVLLDHWCATPEA